MTKDRKQALRKKEAPERGANLSDLAFIKELFCEIVVFQWVSTALRF